MIEDVTRIAFIGGGPLDGHWWVHVSGDGGAGFVHEDGGSVIPLEDQQSIDCYQLETEQGRQVFRYDRRKGNERGYRDRVVGGG